MVSCLVTVRTSTYSKEVQSLVPAVAPRFSCLSCVCLEGAVDRDTLFVDDNAPPHHITDVEELLKSKNIQNMNWPAPVMNLVEHMRDLLGTPLSSHDQAPATTTEMKLYLQEEWDSMLQQFLQTSSLPWTDFANPASHTGLTTTSIRE